MDFIEVWTSKESLMKCSGLGLDMNMKVIPSFPFEGKKTYEGVNYFSKMVKKEDYVICVTLQGEENFEIEVNTLSL